MLMNGNVYTIPIPPEFSLFLKIFKLSKHQNCKLNNLKLKNTLTSQINKLKIKK